MTVDWIPFWQALAGCALCALAYAHLEAYNERTRR